jgi:lactoylglutathione lyase
MSAKVRLNHMSLQVRNLDRSAKFYQEVFLLPEIECGARKSNIRWFGIGDRQSVHLIEGEFGATHVTRSTHFCISTSDLDGAIEHLRNLNVAFCDAAGEQETIRVAGRRGPLGVLQDPNGYWIEVNEDF